MAFVPAVPEAVAAGFTLADVLIALTAALGWAVCFGLLFAWDYTFGFLLQTVASVLDFRVWRFSVRLGGPLLALDNSVKHALSAGISTFDHAMGLFFHWAGLLLAWMANFAMATAQDTLHLARWLTGDHLPKYVKWAIRAFFPYAWLTKLIAQEIGKVIPKLGHIAHALAHDAVAVAAHPLRAVEHEIAKIEGKVTALAHAVEGYAGTLVPPIHLPHPLRWLRDLEKKILNQEKRLAKAEGWIAATALAAAVANVLGVSSRCLRRGNLGKAARSICGMDASLLEDLLVGGLAIVGTLSVVEFAQGLRAIEDETLKVASGLVKEWPS